jgi:hypothetical protein
VGKNEEMGRLWRLICQKDAEVKEELVTCRKQGRRTARYDNLVKDAAKLKKEYEQVKGSGVYDSLSVKHGEKMMSEKVKGDLMGRSGPDTHHGVDGDKGRAH